MRGICYSQFILRKEGEPDGKRNQSTEARPAVRLSSLTVYECELIICFLHLCG